MADRPNVMVIVSKTCPVCAKPVDYFRYDGRDFFTVHSDGTDQCLVATGDPEMLALVVAENEGEA